MPLAGPDDGAVVVVTGASGFVGSHTVKQLLERGYRVRGTVRDATNEEKTKFLRELVPDAKFPLELYSANLTEEGSFDEAVKGCKYAIHCAASVMLTAPDPQRDIVDVTVNGLKYMLDACRREKETGNFTKFVLTSSQSANLDLSLPASHVFTEEDWNESETLQSDPYSYSKVVAEKFGRDYVAGLPEESQFGWACVNPGAIYGPILATGHAGSSPTLVLEMMQGKLPMAPRFSFAAIDVRDVARAQIIAMENEAVSGRYLCLNRAYSMLELAQTCRKMYPRYKFPKRTLPNFLMYTAALFDSRITFRFLRNHLNKVHLYDTSRIERDMEFVFTDILETTMPDTCQSFIDLGLIPDKTRRTPV